MNKHHIPVTSNNATEIEKYRNYEHRLVKEIDNISEDFPKFIDDIVSKKSPKEVLEFNKELVRILAKPSAEESAIKELNNINNYVKNTSEFTPFSMEKITITDSTDNLMSQSRIINKITSNVDMSLHSKTDIDKIYGNINNDINKIIIENIGEIDESKSNVPKDNKSIMFVL